MAAARILAELDNELVDELSARAVHDGRPDAEVIGEEIERQIAAAIASRDRCAEEHRSSWAPRRFLAAASVYDALRKRE